MATRLDLQHRLEEILGSQHVYYQPPETIKLVYPCIIYELADIETTSADDLHYLKYHLYNLTVISRDPDNTIAESILQLKLTMFDRRYVIDNLYHDVLSIYY